VVSQTGDSENITWQAAYEAFGTRTEEDGTNVERQKANTKDEDPTGLLNEYHRYRDLEFGVFISRDPKGFVDGPNVYTYARQNPWSAFDPLGLAEKKKANPQVEQKFEHNFNSRSALYKNHGIALIYGLSSRKTKEEIIETELHFSKDTNLEKKLMKYMEC